MNLTTPIGIGLRYPHYQQIVAEKPNIAWLEVHSENFFIKGGLLKDLLFSIREMYPLSFHGVGLSLGSVEGIPSLHLQRLKELLNQFEPFLISEHLSWSRVGLHHLPDLLPTPYSNEALQVFIDNIDKTQNILQRTLLIENPSSYLEYQSSVYTEQEFLIFLARRTGAKILLDVNNVYVSCCNHGWDAHSYIAAIPVELIGEIHLAGHSIKAIDQEHVLRIDTHDNFVCQEVWELYDFTVKHFSQHNVAIAPTLLEWDADIPSLDVLITEAEKAFDYLPSQQKQNYVNA